MTDQATQELIRSILKDRKAARISRYIRLAAILVIIFTFVGIACWSGPSSTTPSIAKNTPYVALVRMMGVILPGADFSASVVNPELQAAFADHDAKGVVLLMDTPGGSAVQASIIHDKILELKARYHKKVIVVGEDALASGGYLIASAADDIYVNRDTLTGSVGVIMEGFGFVDIMQKLGVSRRVFTAGAHKDRLDPFQPVQPDDVAKIQRVLSQAHQNFIDDVKAGRGKRLHGDPASLFSGDFWTGSEALKLGLVDGTENLWTALQKEFGVRHYKDYTTKASWLQTVAKTLGSQLKIGLTEKTPGIEAKATQW